MSLKISDTLRAQTRNKEDRSTHAEGTCCTHAKKMPNAMTEQVKESSAKRNAVGAIYLNLLAIGHVTTLKGMTKAKQRRNNKCVPQKECKKKVKRDLMCSRLSIFQTEILCNSV